MSVRVVLGDVVPLVLQLEDGDTGKFPQAVVRDEAGSAVSGSPFDLAHRGNGLYGSTSLVMPNEPWITATYIVYSDSGHTTESTTHRRASDYFELTTAHATAAALATVQSDTDDIQARLPATLSGGRMRSQVEGMDAGTVTASAVATDAIDGDAIAASAVTEIQSGLATSAALATVQADTDDIQARLPATLVGGRMRSHTEAMDAGTITSAVIATDAIDGDAIAASAVTEIQSGLATSAALATVQSDTDDIQTRLPAALVSGRMDSSVGAMAANVMTAAAAAADLTTELQAGLATLANQTTILADTDDIQTRLPASLSGGRMRSQVEGMDAGTVTAAAIATDAIDGDAIAASAVTEIQSGLATSASVAAVQSDTDDIQTRLPASLSGGRMRSQVEGMDAGTVTASAVATDAVGEIADGVWDEAVSGHLAAGTFGRFVGRVIAAEATAAAGSTTTVINTGLTQANDFFNNMQVVVINAAGIVARNIDDFANTSGAITVQALPFTPTIGDVVLVLARTGSVPVDAASVSTAVWSQSLPGAFGAGTAGERLATTDDRVDVAVSTRAAPGDAMDLVTDAVDASAIAASAVSEIQSGLATASALATVQSDTDDIQTRLPATLSGGRMRSQVEGMDAGTVTAAAIATDAIDADAIAASAVTEIAAGFGAADMSALLSLLHNNAVVDNTVHGLDGTTSARLRGFSSAAAATAATDGAADGAQGETSRWTITTTYDGAGQIATHRLVRTL